LINLTVDLMVGSLMDVRQQKIKSRVLMIMALSHLLL